MLLLSLMTAAAQPVVTDTDFSSSRLFNEKKVTGIITDRRGLLWVSTWGGLYRFDGYRFVSDKIRPGDGNELDNSRIDDVQQRQDGNLICQSFSNCYLYDVSTSRFRFLPNVKADSMQARRRQIYTDIAFQRDGYHLRLADKQLEWLDTLSGRWQTLVSGFHLWHVNPEGIVWGVMADGRLHRYVVNRPQGEVLDTGEAVLLLYRDRRGFIWQANDDGSVLLRDGRGKRIGYLSPSGVVVGQKTTLARVYSITDDGQGRVLLGTREKGLYVLTPQGRAYSIRQYTHQADDPYSLSDNNIYSLCVDGPSVWVGTLLGGLNLMKTEQGRTVFLHHDNRCPNFPQQDNYHDIRSITKVGSTLVLGSSSGIYTFRSQTNAPEKIRFYQSQRVNDDPRSLASNGLMSVNYIEGKGLFVCPSHAGLCWTDETDLLHDNLRFETWNTDAGAPSDAALQVFADKGGRTWVVYEDVLSQYDLAGHTSADFMQTTNETLKYSGSQPVVTDDGHTLLASQLGVVKVNLAELNQSARSVPLLMTALHVNGQPVFYSLDADTLLLQKDQRNFSLEFAALEMEGTDYVEYAYRLEGRDSTWIQLGQNRTISFFNLGAGAHQLLIRATNNSRVWSQNPRRITIIIQPTFWETPWAWLLYALLALLAVAVVVLIVVYIYRLRLNADFEKRMTDMRLRYFTDISHDLRTPLTLILGPVSELLKDSTLAAKSRDYLSLIHHNAKRMLTLTNQLLDFRKIENSKMRLLIERMDLKEELGEVVDDFRYLAEEHHIELTLQDQTREAAYVWGDKDKIQKIFFNLLSNAFKYTGEGGRVWVELSGDDDHVTATVCDTGQGISQQVMSRLFKRFETILSDNYMKPSTGIGLSLVKTLTEMHHAQLTVSSKEGEGSRFGIVFQKGNNHFLQDQYVQMMTSTDRLKTSETDMITETAADGPADDGGVRLMVVEDDAEMLQFVSGILTPSYHVLRAVDGQDGLEKASQLQPDLIISDINMPRMNGWQMLEQLKQHTETSHIPVVLLTANGTLDNRIKGATEGVDDYIVKPFSPDYLLARVKTILTRQEQMRRRFLETYTQSASEEPAAEEPKLSKPDAEMMEKLRTYMEEHLADDTPIQTLADHVGMSRTLFYNKVKGITGLTPVDFYRKYHIERAAQLMREEGLTVSEACYRTGFSDPKYFSKVFKKFTGQSPSEYKNEGGK